MSECVYVRVFIYYPAPIYKAVECGLALNINDYVRNALVAARRSSTTMAAAAASLIIIIIIAATTTTTTARPVTLTLLLMMMMMMEIIATAKKTSFVLMSPPSRVELALTSCLVYTTSEFRLSNYEQKLNARGSQDCDRAAQRSIERKIKARQLIFEDAFYREPPRFIANYYI